MAVHQSSLKLSCYRAWDKWEEPNAFTATDKEPWTGMVYFQNVAIATAPDT